MAFVRKVKTASGATAVQIAERVAGRDKVLEHLGSAHSDADLTALLATARDRLHPGQGEFDLTAGRVPAGHAVITGKRHALLWQVLTQAYARLGFDVINDEAFARGIVKTCGLACHEASWSPGWWSSTRSTRTPLSKVAPARTRATRWGALTARQRR